MSERDFEAEARRQGWKPQDEWNGAPEQWVDAERFVERGEEIQSHLKEKVSTLESDLRAMSQTQQEFRDFHDKAIAREKAENQRLITELEARRQKAIDDGDGQTFTQADRELNDLRQRSEPESDPGKAEWDRMAADFQRNNPWYGTHNTLTIFADGLSGQLAAKGYTGAAYFNELERQVKAEFPQEFKAQAGTPSVETGGGKVESDPGARTFDALPADAQAQWEKFNKSYGLSKDDYLANYDWDDE